MKKKNVNSKLSLNKETVANLNASMQGTLVGGLPPASRFCETAVSNLYTCVCTYICPLIDL